MSSVYETGHAKNAANFQALIAYVTAYGVNYNPTKVSIQLPNLVLAGVAANEAVSAINGLLPDYSNAVAAREQAFVPLGKLSTRIFNSLKATDALQQVIDNAQTNHRKLTGTRATAKLSEEEKQALLAQGKEVNQVSASQQSYDSRLDSFDKQIQLLNRIPSYLPNEVELQIATLKDIYSDLQTKNTAVITQTIPLSAARIVRNQALYNPETGIVAVAQDVKNYVKSVFGASSANYKLISGIAIRAAKI